MKRNFIDYCILIFKGMAMGAADLVPGVSGGTIAFITGIYEELIGSLGSFRFFTI
jgi:putative membrane protein